MSVIGFIKNIINVIKLNVFRYVIAHDPQFKWLSHCIKVTIIFTISASVVFFYHNSHSIWFMILATFLCDTSLRFEEKDKKKIVIISGVIISFVIFSQTLANQYMPLNLIYMFVIIFLGIYAIRLDMRCFIPGLYMAIFVILTFSMHTNSLYDAYMRVVFSVLGMLLAYIVYFYLPINFNNYVIKLNIKKSIVDLSDFCKSFATHNNEEFKKLRISTWNIVTVIIDLAKSTEEKSLEEELKKYSQKLIEMRRLLVLLYQCRDIDNKLGKDIDFFCQELSKQIESVDDFKQQIKSLEINKDFPEYIKEILVLANDRCLDISKSIKAIQGFEYDK